MSGERKMCMYYIGGLDSGSLGLAIARETMGSPFTEVRLGIERPCCRSVKIPSDVEIN